MIRNIWEVLGIEPTKDKKIIQQAYAEKLRKYHPEEHPEEFQQLQEAYRKASEYARTVQHSYKDTLNTNVQFQSVEKNALEQPMRKIIHNGNNKPIWEPTAQEKEELFETEAEETESIPEYIAQVQNTNSQIQYKEDFDSYIYILQKKLIGYASPKDLKDIEDLFRDNRFCTMLGMKQFRLRVIEVMNYYGVWNQKALKVLLDQMLRLINDSPIPNEEIIELKRYFESKVGKKKRDIPQIEIDINRWLWIVPAILVIVSLSRLWGNLENEKSDPVNHREQFIYEMVYEQMQTEHLPTENGNEKIVQSDTNDEINISSLLYDSAIEYLDEYNCAISEITDDELIIWHIYEDDTRRSLFCYQLEYMLEDFFSNPMIVGKDIQATIHLNLRNMPQNRLFVVSRENYSEECEKLRHEWEQYCIEKKDTVDPETEQEAISVREINNDFYNISNTDMIPGIEGITDEKIELSVPKFVFNDAGQGNEEKQILINKEIQMAGINNHLKMLLSEDLFDLNKYKVDYVIKKANEACFSIHYRGTMDTMNEIYGFSRGITINPHTGEKIPITQYMEIDKSLLEDVIEGKKELVSFLGYDIDEMFYALKNFIADFEDGSMNLYTCYYLDHNGINLIVPIEGGTSGYFIVKCVNGSDLH